jgi:hypothetical protein
VQARRPTPARQTQQHGLGLVVECVPEQHHDGAEFCGSGIQRPVTRDARGRFRPPIRLDHDSTNDDGIQTQVPRLLGGVLGNLG